MPITIRFDDDHDDDLREQVAQLANNDRRSFNAEVLVLLREAVNRRRAPKGVQIGHGNTQVNRF